MNAPLIFVARLDGYVRGFYDKASHTIWIDDRLTPRQYRCTEAHELIHAERGDVDPGEPVARAKQETLVHREAARRLIPIDQLGDAIAWTEEANELAECLNVDLVTLQARLDALTQAEVSYLHQIAVRR